MNLKKFFKIVFTSVFSFCAIATILLVGIYFSNPSLLNNTPYFGKLLSPSSYEKPVNVLFLGLDKVSGNTDVIVLAHFDPKVKKVSVLSILRDTRITIGSRHHKINSVYAIGRREGKNDKEKDQLGLKFAKEKIGELVGQKIDYAVVAKPEGFRNIIDILGGIEVNIPDDMDYDDYDQDLHIHLKKGLQVLNGKKAEEFVRYRHGYTDGDIGRVDAQHIFFKAFIDQKLKPKYILKADQILREVFSNVKTDVPFTEAVKYSVYAKDISPENIVFLKLPGEPKRISGGWYFIHNPEETASLINQNFIENVAQSK